jgi:hypothetical protein
MPKILEYPKAPLKRAVALAEVVDRLGGECTPESAAEAIGNKVGGAFNALVGATVKYGFISSKGGKLKIEPLYTDYKLAYNETEKQEALKKAFLAAPLFSAIAKRFEYQTLPPHFENLLVREHGVPHDIAQRMVGYFQEGAKMTGILQSDGTINAWPKNITVMPGTGEGTFQASSSAIGAPSMPQPSPDDQPTPSNALGYSMRIIGPGIDTSIAIKDLDDLDIVDIMIKKIRKQLAAEDPLLK